MHVSEIRIQEIPFAAQTVSAVRTQLQRPCEKSGELAKIKDDQSFLLAPGLQPGDTGNDVSL